MANTVGDGVVQSRHFGWKPVLDLIRRIVLAPSDYCFWYPKLKEFTKRHKIFWRQGRYLHGICHMAGWKTKNNNSATMGSELWRNTGPSAIQLQETMLKVTKYDVRI